MGDFLFHTGVTNQWDTCIIIVYLFSSQTVEVVFSHLRADKFVNPTYYFDSIYVLAHIRVEIKYYQSCSISHQVELLLKFFVCIVDTELLKTVDFKCLEPALYKYQSSKAVLQPMTMIIRPKAVSIPCSW